MWEEGGVHDIKKKKKGGYPKFICKEENKTTEPTVKEMLTDYIAQSHDVIAHTEYSNTLYYTMTMSLHASIHRHFPNK